MRRVSKGHPPSNVAKDEKPAMSMLDAERNLKGSLASAVDHSEHARNEFDALDKKKLRAVLFAEQHHICVYCERRVKEGEKPPPIDHWRPLSVYPELALHWKNLYLSCTSRGTCDDLKKNSRLVWDDKDSDLPWPSETLYENWIGFTSMGEAYVRADAPLDEARRNALELLLKDKIDGARKRKSPLHLNHPALIAARVEAILGEQDFIDKKFPGRSLTRGEKEKLANEMLQRREYPEFVSIRVAYLTRSLGKNKPVSR